jgi:enoyl-[acyl-carrier protein] reductase I|eukprot:Tamp_04888.p1 GENE.Tamp_04888~~Tamp_04888.p1  ORF type:complete len:403 (-),score=84.68 Tamp_04888:1927-3099(-)
MAFVRSIVIACAVAGCAAFSPAVGAFGRVGSLRKSVSYTPAATTRATPKASSRRAAASSINMGYNVDLTGKVAFIGGVADSSGYGWAIAKQLANAGATIIVGTWPPVLTLFERGIKKGFGEDSKLIDGSDMKIAKVYPLDAMFTDPSEVPDDIKNNKRYAGLENYDIKSCAAAVQKDFGKVDILVHSLANGPEVTRPLLDTTRAGYLAASSASAYSMVAMLSAFGPMMPAGSSAVSLTYLASERVVPGYGGGMSSAKAQLESDTKTLAWEAGRKWGVRVNTISAGPLASRAAIAIKKGAAGERNYIDYCIDYNMANSPLPKPLFADDVGRAALSLCSELTGAVTGTCQYVDNGMHAMGLSLDSSNFKEYIDKQSGDPWDGWKPDVYLKNI